MALVFGQDPLFDEVGPLLYPPGRSERERERERGGKGRKGGREEET